MRIAKSLVLSLFLLALTTTFPSSSFMASAIHSANDLLKPVYDINGDTLRAGVPYYVEVHVLFNPNVSASHGIPTLAFSDISEGSCPNEVVLSKATKFPVTITKAAAPNEIIIPQNTHLTFKFDISYLCRMIISLIWGLDEYKDPPVLTARGYEGFNTIKITKYETGKYIYQLTHCTVLIGSKCRELGSLIKNGVNYVSPGKPIPIKFRPALPHQEAMDVMK